MSNPAYLTSSKLLISDPEKKAKFIKTLRRAIKIQDVTDEAIIDIDWRDEPDGLWFYSDEYFTPDKFADVVQHYLKRYEPDGIFSFEWAITCDRPKLNSFFGGACVVTAGDQQWMSTDKWTQDKVKELQDANPSLRLLSKDDY